MLLSAGGNLGRLKRFFPITVLQCALHAFQIVKTRVIRLRVIEDPNTRDQITFCIFHSFFVEVQTNAGYIHVTHAK